MDAIFQTMLDKPNRTIEICKLINPRDANPLGRMHGGNVLSLLEEAGIVAATRHLNLHRTADTPPCVAALVRMEKVDFLAPIEVGDVVEVDSEVTFTSDRSCEISITIETLSTMKGDMSRRLTTTAHLWFVALYHDSEAGETKVAKMPHLKLSEFDQEVAQQRYKAQKDSRSLYFPARTKIPTFVAVTPGIFDKHTVRNSQTMMSHYVNVDECDMFRNMRGGPIMKLADEVCGIVAWRHCQSICVTASVDACNFQEPIPAGACLYLNAYPTFSSPKSLEVEVVLHYGGIDTKTMELSMRDNVFNALYTFVAVDLKGRASSVPPLILESDFEEEIFERGRQRYQARMTQREASSIT